MMFCIVIVFIALALVAAAAAAPLSDPDELLRSEIDSDPTGHYRYEYETKNGSKRFEEAQVKTVTDEENTPRKVLSVHGSYSYIDPEGNVETINYEADENGYRAEGPSIPKLPAAAARR